MDINCKNTQNTKYYRYIYKAMVFPVVLYGCESWTVKKAEHRRIDDFELWCWRRLLRVPWTARRSNQSILREIGRTDVEAETPVSTDFGICEGPGTNPPWILRDNCSPLRKWS